MDTIKKLLVICGPTATGKTALALSLAKKFNGELVSADSRQVYKGMDIGTGKDVKGFSIDTGRILHVPFHDDVFELAPYVVEGVNLWMLDVVSPDASFSVSQYETLAQACITDIRSRGKLPIVVGGTGLYIQSILSPLATSDIPPNTALRSKLEPMALEELQQELAMKNPVMWQKLNESDRQNKRRLIRKLEIHAYGQTKAFLGPREKIDSLNPLIVCLRASYPFLYQRIDERVDKRIQEGIITEIRHLISSGMSFDSPSMNTLGYKEWKEYFFLNEKDPDGKGFQTAIRQWKFDEHAYARRQMTWFKKMPINHWINIETPTYKNQIESVIGSWYTG